MGLIWPLLAGIALWALVRLGRLGERAGRGHWRIAATIFGAVLMAGAVLVASHGAWVGAASVALAGLYLIFSSRLRSGRVRPTSAQRERMVPASLSEAEARSILGVDARATREDIQSAWRRLMARVHPDQGGAEGLAAHLNAARDRLLKP